MKITKMLHEYYLGYAKYTIVSRAIAKIDGLKPVQRRVLYSMHDLGLDKSNARFTKSVKVVGDVMGRFHPHGDSSIYGSAVYMSAGHNAFNTPYIESKGNFGKVYARDWGAAHPRYTEMKLSKIAREFTEGLNENAVDFVRNFDDTTDEPDILPVKFPSILVNSSAGIAVGTSSNIPSYSLIKVCNALCKKLAGEIENEEQLAEELGSPEFTTGGFVHCGKENLVKLCKTGKGTLTLTGRLQAYSNRLEIVEIPYNTTAEDIIDSIKENIELGNLNGIIDIKDEIGIDGFKIVIELKKGINSREVAESLIRYTPFRTKISFITRVILGNRYKTIGVYDLLNEWIAFRIDTIRRMYQYRVDRLDEKEARISVWDKIRDCIAEVVDMIAHNSNDKAKEILISKYSLTEIQAEYLLDMKLRSITPDRAKKAMQELADLRIDKDRMEEIVASDEKIKQIIISENREIIDGYGKDNKTEQLGELPKEYTDKKVERVINNELVTVVMTREGYLKRLTTVAPDRYSYGNDEEVIRWMVRNNQYILVFDRLGGIHKILVDDIDQSRAKPTDKIHEMAGLEKFSDILFADESGDFTGHVNIVYGNGRGNIVRYDNVSGKRMHYKSVFEDTTGENVWVTKEDDFLMITNKEKASYIDLKQMVEYGNIKVFKLGRVGSGEGFIKLINKKDIYRPDLMDLSKYVKGYTVKLGGDLIWLYPPAVEEVTEELEDIEEVEEGEYSF